ncbi:cysteine-rich secretory protein 2-like isoform X2 [Antechinus flavipes]|uniref:cysteine-rich secretory protein 2-like isoform X2 n=1 Tax=Antechinus flavipes TaxID=38775 RepID=UPI002236177A|nr:cysteine-rich secretory protein 2-like isoform X2 [Antechinus flavipes]
MECKRSSTKAMTLLPGLLSLASILLLFCGDAKTIDFESLSTEDEKNQQEIVDKHNGLRAQASPPASNMLKMEWLQEAQKTAQIWAETCSFKHSDQKDRTIESVCGENLYMSTAPTTWSGAIQSWYDEVLHFKFEKGSTSGEAVGHYTQVMWYNSYQVGCGVAKCPNSYFKYFFVCHYCPAGNVLPKQNSPYEIGTPCSKCPDSCSNNLCNNPCKYSNDYGNCDDLKKQVTCQHPIVHKHCKASCQCTNKIY